MQGTIKTYLSRGFGFIATENERDIFFHVKDVQNLENEEQLQPGVPVTFDVHMADRGPAAYNIELVGGES